MKSTLYELAFRMAIVAGAAVVAYLIGWARHAPATNASTKPRSKPVPSAVVTPDGTLVTPFGIIHIPDIANLDASHRTLDAQTYKFYTLLQLTRLFVQDHQKALAELAKLPSGPDKDGMYDNIFSAWSSHGKEAPQAVAAAYGLPAGIDRTLALEAAIRGWAKADPSSLLNWAGALPRGDSGLLADTLSYVAKSQNNPVLAAQYLDKLTDATARTQVIGNIAATWAQSDPAATLDWLDLSATGDDYGTNVNSLMKNLAKKDPAQAAALTDKISEPDVQSAAVANAASAWGAIDPEATIAWLKSLPDSEAMARNAGLSSAVASWAVSDPAAARAYIQNASDPSIYLGAAPAVADNLSRSDPQTALDWANSLPAGAAKDQALSNVLDNIGHTDFNTAWSLATSQPAGNGRDLALAGLVGVEAQTNPDEAVKMLGQFPAGSSAQTNATGQLAAVWGVQNPDSFIQWVSALPAGDSRNIAMSAAIQAAKLITPMIPRNQTVMKLTKAQALLSGQ